MNVDAVLSSGEPLRGGPMTGEPRPGGLLAVHAHPDDETLATGALLAAWAESGAPVTLVTCTRGERGEVIGPDPAQLEGNGPALAAHRETELAVAVAALGVTKQIFLDQLRGSDPRGNRTSGPIEDSGMVWLPGQRSGTAEAPEVVPPGAFVAVPLEDAARPLADLILSDRPDVVVTYDPAGGYGHPDHVRTHEVTMRAVELVAEVLRRDDHAQPLQTDQPLPTDYAGPLVLWASMRPADLQASWHELRQAPWVRTVAAAHGLEAPAADSGLPAVASTERTVQIEVEVAPVLDRVLAALHAHATQVHAIEPAPTTSAGILACYALSNNVLGAVPRQETYAPAPAQAPADGHSVIWPAGVGPVA